MPKWRPRGAPRGAKRAKIAHDCHRPSFGCCNFGAPWPPKGSKILIPEAAGLQGLEAGGLTRRRDGEFFTQKVINKYWKITQNTKKLEKSVAQNVAKMRKKQQKKADLWHMFLTQFLYYFGVCLRGPSHTGHPFGCKEGGGHPNFRV